MRINSSVLYLPLMKGRGLVRRAGMHHYGVRFLWCFSEFCALLFFALENADSPHADGNSVAVGAEPCNAVRIREGQYLWLT